MFELLAHGLTGLTKPTRLELELLSRLLSHLTADFHLAATRIRGRNTVSGLACTKSTYNKTPQRSGSKDWRSRSKLEDVQFKGSTCCTWMRGLILEDEPFLNHSLIAHCSVSLRKVHVCKLSPLDTTITKLSLDKIWGSLSTMQSLKRILVVVRPFWATGHLVHESLLGPQSKSRLLSSKPPLSSSSKNFISP